MKRMLVVVAFLLSVACGEPRKPEQPSTKAVVIKGPPYLLFVTPRETVEKKSFNVQADGGSAFAVNGKGFDPHAVITANGQKLPTTFGNAGWLTAEMPAELYANAGVVTINVVNSSGKKSNSFEFKVTPAM